MKPIANFPGYWVDSDGNVFSSQEQVSDGFGFKTLIHDVPIRKLTPQFGHGYYFVTLYKNGCPFLRRIHHLVLEAFVGPRPFPSAVARHLNGTKIDNQLANLAWGTQKENVHDKMAVGRSHYPRPRGRRLSDDDVRAIRASKGGEAELIRLASKIGCHVSYCYRIRAGRARNDC
jgi:hypothetical protein